MHNVVWGCAEILPNPEREVSEAFLGLSRRPPLLPDKTSLAVNDYRSYKLIYRFVSKLHWY